ncbi:MAG: IS5/IS1182 family transposase, partial [Thermoactinomycetaceae bacterium]|nr:IS5/IS1182 family transposase [Thermoactinomycetaceae bacterium]
GYRRRWIIERCFGWMNNYRRLVVRYDRYLHIYRAFCLIAFIIWCVNRILK